MQKRNRLRVARLHIPVRLNFQVGLHNLQMRHVHGRPTVGYNRPTHATSFYLGLLSRPTRLCDDNPLCLEYDGIAETANTKMIKVSALWKLRRIKQEGQASCLLV